MQRTALDTSLEGLSFAIYYQDYHIDIDQIEAPNFEDILYVKCYPKWDMQEEGLMQLIEDNKSFLFSKMEDIVNENDLFYCHFDIDFSKIIGTTTKIVDHRVRWIEARPNIKKKHIEDYPSGFINPNDLPEEN